MNKAPFDILAMMSDPAVALRGSRIAYANSAARELFGADCTGKNASALLGPTVTEAQSAAFVTELTVHALPFSARVSVIDGERVIILKRKELTPPLINDAFLCSARDNLMTISCALDLMRDKAEQKGLTGFIPDIAAMTRSSFRLSRLISNVDLARKLIDGSLCIQACPTDLSQVLGAVIDTVGKMFTGTEFTLLCPEHCSMIADRELIDRMLLNLLSNCITHAKGCTRVTVRVTDTPENVFISVSDNGCGIAPDDLAGIFSCYDRRFQLRSLNSGAGLGLTIVSGIARVHGGTVMLESRQDAGTAVSISLNKKRRPAYSIFEGAEVYRPGMKSVLEELSDCLPCECYTAAYMD